MGSWDDGNDTKGINESAGWNG